MYTNYQTSVKLVSTMFMKIYFADRTRYIAHACPPRMALCIMMVLTG